MNKIEIIQCNSKSELKQFIDLPYQLYQGHPFWVAPLKMAVKDLLNPKHPFFETGEVCYWLAKLDGKISGRIAAVNPVAYNQFHQSETGFFGFFECINNPEIADKLFESAHQWLKNKGLKNTLGPFNPSTNYEAGTLVDGFEDPPQIMMTYNDPYHRDLIEGQGYRKAKDLLAYRKYIDQNTKVPDLIQRIAERTEKRNRITYRFLNKKNWDSEVQNMLEIYNDAWEKNWGFVPMTEAEFKHTAKDLKLVVDEKLVIFVEVDGECAGFIVGLPDLNQIFKTMPHGSLFPFGFLKLLRPRKYTKRLRVPTLGVKMKFRKLGLESLLYNQITKAAVEGGFQESESSWILEDNINMNKPLLRMGMEPYKTYRIFQKDL